MTAGTDQREHIHTHTGNCPICFWVYIFRTPQCMLSTCVTNGFGRPRWDAINVLSSPDLDLNANVLNTLDCLRLNTLPLHFTQRQKSTLFLSDWHEMKGYVNASLQSDWALYNYLVNIKWLSDLAVYQSFLSFFIATPQEYTYEPACVILYCASTLAHSWWRREKIGNFKHFTVSVTRALLDIR